MPIDSSIRLRYRSIACYLQAQASQEAAPREWYKMLRAYYENNGLYDQLYEYMRAMATDAAGRVDYGALEQALCGLRNPAYRAVEFYAMHLWPGDLDTAFRIETDKERLADAIMQVWQWSNWAVKKQVAARWYARDGDLFIKVVQPEGVPRVYFQLIEAQYVSDFEEDERGYMTYCRIDVPQWRRNGDKVESYTRTEVWDKAGGDMRIWEHDKGLDAALARLGPPTQMRPLADMGIDFVPIVRAPFADVGEKRGASCFGHVLDKIDEANRQATRLHQMLFRHNDNIWAVQSDFVDPSGRPIPPPTLSTTTRTRGDGTTEEQVELNGSKLARLPSGWKLQSLVPTLQYADALAILTAHMREIEDDLPELIYYRIRDLGTNISGRAVRMLLAGAIAKAEEARGNAVSALVRANQMAITIGQAAGIEGFDVGTYEAGDLEHTLILPELFALDESERLQDLQLKRSALEIPLETLWAEYGYSEEQIADMLAKRQSESSIGAQLLKSFETQWSGS